MQTLFIGQNVIELSKIPSTNSYAFELIQSSNPLEGTIIFTQNQTHGRGQRGNSWHSQPYRNLSLSIILKPAFLAVYRQFDLNKAISLGVCDFINELLHSTSYSCKIKWPNDIYIEDKKLGGILIENILKTNQLATSIVGIGLNINQEFFDSTTPNPISLYQLTHAKYDLFKLLEKLCVCLETRYLHLKNNHIARLNSNYLSVLFRYNSFHSYTYKGDTIMAKIIGISDQGKLILEKENKTIISSDFKEIGFII